MHEQCKNSNRKRRKGKTFLFPLERHCEVPYDSLHTGTALCGSFSSPTLVYYIMCIDVVVSYLSRSPVLGTSLKPAHFLSLLHRIPPNDGSHNFNKLSTFLFSEQPYKYILVGKNLIHTLNSYQ